ncbi:MAG TPA: acyl-CoA dehydrogenase family protein [Steroidobacteraceae bacterium]|nr:acyl-CoA dehydrogenase family protein [Steroidobacteraceae bacterium]
MDFTFTDEQRLMQSSFRELAEDLCSSAEIRAAFEGRSERAALRWSRVAHMGLTAMLAPAQFGGLGLDAVDFALIAQEAGRAAFPEPLSEHAGVAVPLLAQLSCVPAAAALLARAGGAECMIGVMHDANPFTLWPAGATHLLVCRAEEVHLARAADVRAAPQPSVDALRRLASIDADLGAHTLIARGAEARGASERALERGALFAAAESVGLAERMIQLAVDYAAARTQFGAPIGSYQAIKHALASAQVRLEFARPVLYSAASRGGETSVRGRALVSHAKIAATDAADLAGRTAMQVHGAMGYSWEVDLHFYMKRAWALAGAWGDRNFHARRLQSLVLDGAIALGPDHTFDSP